jgi:hypothetical protein
MTLIKDVLSAKDKLQKKAKTKGIYENFGQEEYNKLLTKYGDNGIIQAFDNWRMNFCIDDIS